LRERFQGFGSECWAGIVQIEYVNRDLPPGKDPGLSLAEENQGVEAVDRRTPGNIEEVEGAGRFFD